MSERLARVETLIDEVIKNHLATLEQRVWWLTLAVVVLAAVVASSSGLRILDALKGLP